MVQAKRYVFDCVIGLLVLVLCTALLNWWQDPAGAFSDDNVYESTAKALCEGKGLVISGNYDERAFIKSVVWQGDNDYDVVVLGSSRVMSIGDESVSKFGALRSLAVSGAALEDDVAIWHCYKKKMSSVPKVVIIDGAPWLFNKNSEETRWKNKLALDYVEALHDMGFSVVEADDYNRYKTLFSMMYTKESLKKLCTNKESVPIEIWDETENSYEDKQILHSDGSRIYSQKTLQGDADASARAYISGKVYHVEEYNNLDTERQKIFEKLVKDIQSKGTTVVIFLPPYHPIVYDYLKKEAKYSNVFAAERWYRSFAAENGVVIIGGYNPSSIGLDDKAFFDGMHMRRGAQGEYVKKALMNLNL